MIKSKVCQRINSHNVATRETQLNRNVFRVGHLVLFAVVLAALCGSAVAQIQCYSGIAYSLSTQISNTQNCSSATYCTGTYQNAAGITQLSYGCGGSSCTPVNQGIQKVCCCQSNLCNTAGFCGASTLAPVLTVAALLVVYIVSVSL